MKTPKVIKAGTTKFLDVFGPTLQLLTSPSEPDIEYCVMEGTIPPGVSVPLHSHPDNESFYVLAGVAQFLAQQEGGFNWLELKVGDFVHIPGNVKHAWKNTATENLVTLTTTTPALGRFFQEVGRVVEPGEQQRAPTPEEIGHFVQISIQKYHYWLGTPEENAAVGISLSMEG
ncbi:cupin domain-containing protein [Hymenobacter terricola]|uniref:cupin domain-containing protein n=1 Tax=Hymenobacter terricola TaxID=2819236 RepID=UPI001B30F3DB|nr:cupin domain-containing protein [Hymenobacter terricola]